MASKAKRRPSWKKSDCRLFENPDLAEAWQEAKHLSKLFRNASKYQEGTKSFLIAGDALFTHLGKSD